MLVVTVPRERLAGFTLGEVEKRRSASCRGPALFLTGSEVPQPSISDVEVTQYPISLAKLAMSIERGRLNAEPKKPQLLDRLLCLVRRKGGRPELPRLSTFHPGASNQTDIPPRWPRPSLA